MNDETMRREAQTVGLCLPPALRKPTLRRWEACEYLKILFGIVIAPATMAKLASTGGGPRFLKGTGRTPYYPIAELDAWAAQRLGRLVASTSDVSNETPPPLHQPADA